MSRLTPDQVQSFHDNGFHFPVRVFEPAEARRLRARFESIADLTSPLDATGLQGLHGWVWDLVHDPRIVEPVQQLLGPDLLLWSADLIVKEPGDERFYSYHQDCNYWGLKPHDILTAWVALSDAGPSAGPMSFVPGSHREALTHEDTSDRLNMLSRGQTIPGLSHQDSVLAPLETGEMSLHHVGLAHASRPNRSDDLRIGLALRFMAPHVRQTKGEDSATLISGEDRYGHFTFCPRPKIDGGEEEQKRRLHSMQCRAKILLPEGAETPQAFLPR